MNRSVLMLSPQPPQLHFTLIPVCNMFVQIVFLGFLQLFAQLSCPVGVSWLACVGLNIGTTQGGVEKQNRKRPNLNQNTRVGLLMRSTFVAQ